MTTPQHARSLAGLANPVSGTVLVAGVPWPRYKLIAVLAGLITLLAVGVLTTSAAPAVLAAAAVAGMVGLLLKTVSRG